MKNHSKQTGIAPIIIILIIVGVLVAGGGIYYSQTQKLTPQNSAKLEQDKTTKEQNITAKQQYKERLASLPRLNSIVTVKGKANKSAGAGERTVYLLGFTANEGFSYLSSDCDLNNIEKCSSTGVGSTIELVEGTASLSSIISDEPKLVEIRGVLKWLPYEKKIKGMPESRLVIVVDNIKEIDVGGLPRPPLEGIAKFVEEAIKNNNPDACQKAVTKDKYNKVIDDKSNTCLRELAITLQDISICALMKREAVNDPFTPDNCYEALAYIKFDKNLCEKINLKDASCQNMYSSTERKMICEPIVANKTECLKNFSIYEKALNSNNPSACKSSEQTYSPINEAIGNASCVAEYAWQAKNLSACEKLYDGFMQVFYTNNEYQGLKGQEWCIYRNSVLKKDYSQCDKLTDSFAREMCKR